MKSQMLIIAGVMCTTLIWCRTMRGIERKYDVHRSLRVWYDMGHNVQFYSSRGRCNVWQ